jgi:Fe-S-cluster containining protein
MYKGQTSASPAATMPDVIGWMVHGNRELAGMAYPQTCDNCGVCCLEQNTPPGYVTVMMNPAAWPPDSAEHERVEQLPDAARQVIVDRITDDGSLDGMPCCWLDLKTKRCRWYEHRPQICRNMEIGSKWCRSWRERYGIKPMSFISSSSTPIT